MKKTTKRLTLNRETLNKTQLEKVSGGSIGCPMSIPLNRCYQPTQGNFTACRCVFQL